MGNLTVKWFALVEELFDLGEAGDCRQCGPTVAGGRVGPEPAVKCPGVAGEPDAEACRPEQPAVLIAQDDSAAGGDDVLPQDGQLAQEHAFTVAKAGLA